MWNSKLNIVFAYGALYNFFRSMTGAFSSLFLLQNGISLQDLGYLKGLQAVFVVICDLPLSILSDRTNRKYMAAAGVAFSALFLIITGFHQNFWHLVMAEIANALSVSIFSSTIDSYVADVSDNESVSPSISLPRFNSYQFAAMALGGICGVTLFLPQNPTAWIVAGSGSILTVLVFLPFLPSTKTHLNKNVRNSFIGSARLAAIKLTENTTMRLVAVAFIANSIFFQILIQFWQPMALAADPSLEKLLGVLFVATLFAQSIASYIMEFLAVRRKSPLILGYAILTISSFGFAASTYWHMPVLAFVCMFSLFLGNRIAITHYKVQIVSFTSSRSRAVTLSSLSLSIRLSIAAALPIFAWTINAHGWAAVMVLAALLFGTALVSTGIIKLQQGYR